jgi:hypothetical protein
VAKAGDVLTDDERGMFQLEADVEITRLWLRPA